MLDITGSDNPSTLAENLFVKISPLRSVLSVLGFIVSFHSPPSLDCIIGAKILKPVTSPKLAGHPAFPNSVAKHQTIEGLTVAGSKSLATSPVGAYFEYLTLVAGTPLSCSKLVKLTIPLKFVAGFRPSPMYGIQSIRSNGPIGLSPVFLYFIIYST